ncbi:MAG: hypothetical protein R3B49_09675 [Phycisphaerales bacterium]
MSAKTRTARTAAITLAAAILAGSALSAGGCRTAMRGAGYKRLISSYAEAVKLEDLTAQRLAEEEAAGADEARLAKIRALHEEVSTLSSRWHDSLDRRRREGWNRTTMNICWGKYTALFPDARPLREEYRQQRRIEIDELRSRRTPLTHDQRLPWAPPAHDPLPYSQKIWPGPVERKALGLDEPTYEGGAKPTIEPYYEPTQPNDGSTEELLRDLLEDQGRSGG